MMQGVVVAVLLCLSVSVQAGSEMSEDVLRNINLYNFRSKCWGESNMDLHYKTVEEAKTACRQEDPPSYLTTSLTSLSNPFSTNSFLELRDLSSLPSLWRTRREARQGLLKPDQDDLYQFLAQFQDFKSDLMSNMGNLTCVLTKMMMLTPEGDINIDYYTTALTQETPLGGFVFDVEGSAASDPEWRQKMSDGHDDCFKISQTWPQSSFNRHSLSRMFGRHMIFFKCAHKTETKLCAESQMLQWLGKLYGPLKDEDRAAHLDRLGLPEDKYDAAAISVAVITNALSQEEKFVDEFFWGMSEKSE